MNAAGTTPVKKGKPLHKPTQDDSKSTQEEVTSTEAQAEKHPVAQATVPDKSFLKSYITRVLPGNKSEFDVFDYGRTKKFNILIEGPTGPGKTSASLAYAAREEMPFYAIPSNIGIEPSQLFGKFIPDGNGGFKWVDGPVTALVRSGGFLLINEVNFIPERVATVLFGLLDKRRQIILLDHEHEVITAHDDLLIVADMNPDYEGTRPLNKAFRNRFAIQLFWDYDPVVESKLVKSESLLKMATQIRTAAAQGEYETPLSTNMLMEFVDIYADMGMDFAMTNFMNHYADHERGAVKMVLDTHRVNIEGDLAVPETDEEQDLWDARAKATKGYVDPEWGVYGTNWAWEDDDPTPAA